MESKFPDVRFEKIDLDDQSTRNVVEKYGISGIPHIVFLDGSGNVLYSGSPMRTEDGLAGQIQQYR